MKSIIQKTAPSQLGRPGIMRRLFSMLYEILLLLAVLFFSAYIFLALTQNAQSVAIKIVFQIYLVLIIAIYFLWFWCKGGQTLAMKTWHLRLVSAHGASVTLTQCGLRFVAAFIGIGLGGVSILWALIDRDRQFLHDRIAGTKIILL